MEPPQAYPCMKLEDAVAPKIINDIKDALSGNMLNDLKFLATHSVEKIRQ